MTHVVVTPSKEFGPALFRHVSNNFNDYRPHLNEKDSFAKSA